jgi:TonB-linked SusC/RagA family outer membrane protein
MTEARKRGRILGGLLVVVSCWSGVLDGQSRQASVSVGALAVQTHSPLHRTARLNVHNLSLSTALLHLRQRSGVDLAFSTPVISPDHRVNCECAAVTVAEALDRMLAGTALIYAEFNGQIIIEPRPRSDHLDRAGLDDQPWNGADAGLRRRIAPALGREDSTVSGVVVDTRSQPLRAARVVVEGTTSQTMTDQNGRFRLTGLVGPQVTLTVRMLGYRPSSQVVRIGDAAVRIVMTEVAFNLDEIVVTGTAGATEKRAVGNTVGRVNAAELLETAPISGMGQMLNARVPGVIVMGDLGVIGAGPRIRIRGRTSISLKSDPIIYIDGIRVSNETGTGPALQGSNTTSRLADIDPNQIESIEIIKGPAAATLYGTEASNGVIQIITKRGAPSDRPVLTLMARQGANWFMNAEDRIARVGLNYNRTSTGELLGPFNIFESEREAGRSFFQTGILGSYGLHVTGGTQSLQYFAGGDFTSDNGVEPTNKLRRFSGRTNVNFMRIPQVDVNVSLGFVKQRTDLSMSEAAFCTVCMVLRAQPRLKNTLSLGFFPGGNPYANREAVSLWQNIDRYTVGLQANHRPNNWFSQRLAVGSDQTSQDDNFLVELPHPEIAAQLVFAQWRRGTKTVDYRLISVNTVDYGASARAGLTERISSNTSVGLQYFGALTRTSRVSGNDFPAPGLTAVSAAATRSGEEDFIENVTVGMYVEQRFSFDDRLFVTGAVRGDDNSSFGEHFNLVTYPKISGSWVVSEEPFWKIDAISQLRLRAAYGQSGQQPQSFAALQTYTPTTGPAGAPALTPGSVGNPDLGPERGEELELGFDGGLFRDRLGIEFTYYNKRTEGAILLRQNAPSSGFAGTQFVNAGLVTNRGIELLLKGIPIESRSLRWDVALNFSANRNKVVDLDPDDPSLTFIPTLFENRIAEGYPISGHFKQKVVSATYNPATRRMDNIMCDGGTGFQGLEPGGAPVPCSSAPRLYLGQAEPRFEGALTNGFTIFDRLHVSALLDFKGGNKLFFADRFFTCTTYLICDESPGILPETVNPVHAAEAQIGASNIAVSHYLSDATFLKLREVSLSYRFSDRWARAVRASRARITVAGRNLHTWTRYIGLDPESFRPHLLEEAGGYSYRDQGGMPSLASIQASVSLTW